MRTDVDCEIRFGYPDIVRNADSEHYAVGWKAGRWVQYVFSPKDGDWWSECPIFLAGREVILDSFGLAKRDMDLTALVTISPPELQSLGRAIRDLGPYYTVQSVTTFLEWRDLWGTGWTGVRCKAERLANGLWVTARLDSSRNFWVTDSQVISDLDMWKQFEGGPKRYSAGQLRSFRWKSIFLAHSSSDKDFVRSLATRLKALGIRVWIDESEIRIGDSLIARIESAIDEIDYLGVVLTPNSVNSRWVREELNMALNRQIQSGETKILPILLKDAAIPGFLREKRYADFRDPVAFEGALQNLLEVLQDHFTNQDHGRTP